MTDQSTKPGRLMVPALFISSLSAQSGQILKKIEPCLLPVATIFSIVMGVLSIAYNHKTLYVLGSLALVISGIASPLSPTLSILLIAYSFTGLGLAITSPPSFVLVGRFYPQEKRSGVISWIVAGMSVSYLVGTLAIAYLSSIGGWRLAFEVYVLPLYIIGLVMVLFFIPNPGSSKIKINMGAVSQGFKAILYNRSAASCLVGYALSMAAWQFSLLYGMSFLRIRFGVLTAVVTLFMMATSLSFTVGGLLGGRLVNKYGRRMMTMFTTLAVGPLTLAGPNIPLFELYMLTSLVLCFVSGTMFTAFNSLLLEQVPSQRGTMMSLSNAGQQMG